MVILLYIGMVPNFNSMQLPRCVAYIYTYPVAWVYIVAGPGRSLHFLPLRARTAMARLLAC
jgi:hypothetical protein